MSCFHGNHPDACDICDEVDAASKRGYEAGFKACLRENFTTQPQRTWVGLTDEDMADITSLPIGTCAMMLKVIAKLKDKNT